jgi:hypothetical protein
MGRKHDETALGALLEAEWDAALKLYLDSKTVAVAETLTKAADTLFSSKTQSYREALIGCFLAKLTDPAVDVRLPYATQGDNAFKGRDIDEDIVNPFLQQRQVPCSKGPYLAVFRRNIKFNQETRTGLRDKTGYDAFLVFVGFLKDAKPADAKTALRHLLWKFIELREKGRVQLSRVQRLSIEQYERLLNDMLQVPSGGLLPVCFAVAMFQTLAECFMLDWEIESQGINAADSAAGVGGDITIRSGGAVRLAVEVTERQIERNRVVTTFNTKIVTHGLEDYLFLFTFDQPAADARAVAEQYSGQGHDISFLPLAPWIVSCLGTIGPSCRRRFTERLIELLDQPSTPARVKIAWNEKVGSLLR